MGNQGFFRELRRRHVFRVAIAYAVTAWLLLQLAAIVLPAFGAPHWVLKVLIGVFVLFFPIAIIVAWAFEVTPEGVRHTESAASEAARPARVSRNVGRTLDIGITVVLAAAGGVLAWRQFGSSERLQVAGMNIAALAEPHPMYKVWALALAYHAADDKVRAHKALQTLIAKNADEAAYQIAEVYAYFGQPDQAFAWLDRAWRQHDPGITELLFDPLLKPYRKDPRFAAFCRKVAFRHLAERNMRCLPRREEVEHNVDAAHSTQACSAEFA